MYKDVDFPKIGKKKDDREGAVCSFRLNIQVCSESEQIYC